MDTWKFVYGFSICFLSIITNGYAIHILSTTKQLKKSRFHFLVLLLSISDLSVVSLYTVHHFVNYFNTGADMYLYGCMILKHSVGGSIGFSQIQTLMICIERLHATFSVNVKFLKYITTNIAISVAFLMSQLYTFIPAIIEIVNGPQPCTVEYTARYMYVLTLDVPLLFSALSIIALYIIVIRRICKQQIMIIDQSKPIELCKRNNALKRKKMNIITLGIIVLVTSIAIIPRELIAFYSIIVEQTESVLQLVLIGNHLTLINPLIDPIIYVLRFKEVRDRIICRKTSASMKITRITVVPSSSLNTISSVLDKRDWRNNHI